MPASDAQLNSELQELPQGADTVIQERLSAEGKVFWKETQSHLEEFGKTGLRTLCLAYRWVTVPLCSP